jgi:hypothetical protein
MSIAITNGACSPNQISNASTVSATITFTGNALKNSTDVIVDFKISPYPDLSFNGSETVSNPYTFDTTNKPFSKTVNIQNQSSPASTSWLNGLIALTATEHNTGNTDGTYAPFVYK